MTENNRPWEFSKMNINPSFLDTQKQVGRYLEITTNQLTRATRNAWVDMVEQQKLRMQSVLVQTRIY